VSNHFIFLFLDIISLRNVQPDRENPFRKINTILSKEFKTAGKSRPFSTILHNEAEKSFLLDLFLLPHQQILFPINYREMVQLPEDSETTIHDIETVRYFIFLSNEVENILRLNKYFFILHHLTKS
jgi:hypothetical protein